MKKRQKAESFPTLATRLMTAQVAVIAVGSLVLAICAVLLAPALFHRHLSRAGVTDVRDVASASARRTKPVRARGRRRRG